MIRQCWIILHFRPSAFRGVSLWWDTRRITKSNFELRLEFYFSFRNQSICNAGELKYKKWQSKTYSWESQINVWVWRLAVPFLIWHFEKQNGNNLFKHLITCLIFFIIFLMIFLSPSRNFDVFRWQNSFFAGHYLLINNYFDCYFFQLPRHLNKKNCYIRFCKFPPIDIEF